MFLIGIYENGIFICRIFSCTGFDIDTTVIGFKTAFESIYRFKFPAVYFLFSALAKSIQVPGVTKTAIQQCNL